MAILAGAAALLLTAAAAAQPLDELDEERYLRGLTELELPEVLDHYLELYPTDDAAVAMVRQQHQDRLSLLDAAHSSSEQEAIVRRMMERYDELLDGHADDPRRATWITDQAGDVYFHWMMVDAAVWTTLLGIAPPEELLRVRRATERMVELAEQAHRIVLDAIVQLEDAPGFENDLALQSQRRRLLSEHRDRRVPFFRGIALHLHARFNIEDAQERRQSARQAADMLNDVIPRLEGSLQHQATIHAAYARLLEGDGERAAMFFARVLEDDRASSLLRFAAAVGEAHRTEPQRGPEAALDRLERTARDLDLLGQPYFLLLLADQRLILRSGPAREAYAAYLDLIEHQPADRREPMRQLVLSRLAGHADRFDRMDDAPPAVRIADAHVAARDPQRSDEAIDRLERLRAQSPLTQRDSAFVAQVLAQLYRESGRPEAAAATLIEFAQAHPQHADALPSVERALAHATEVYRAETATGRVLLQDALALLFDQFPDSANVDHWRMVAARLALNQEEYDAAIRNLEQIRRQSNAWQEAMFLLIEVERRAARLATDSESRYLRLLERVEELETLPRGEPAEMSREERMLLRVYRAEAQLALGDADRALETLDALAESRDSESLIDLPAAVVTEMLPIRIRAYEALGRTDRAGEMIDQLVGAAPERAFDLLLPMIDAAEQRVGRLIRQHRHDDAETLAQRELLPLAKRLHQWHEAYGSDEHALMVGRRLADAHRYSGECDLAMRWYERLLEDHRNALPLLVGRAECLFISSEDDRDPKLAEAMAIYRRVAGAESIRGEEPYWLSQLRMLQILDRVGRNTERILPRIQQLRQLDPELGGDPFRRQFETLQSRYAP